jgi:hypothetical protein
MRTVEANVKTLAAFAALLLSACGGGGASPTSIGPTQPVAGQPASISYISATPPVITTVNAVTGNKISVLRFIVKDGFGNPANNGTAVNFVLTGPSGGKQPSNGGEYIGSDDGTPTTASTTTAGGVAEVNLVSGAVAGPATVTASVAGTGISTPSAAISIGGGVPSANHFLLAATRINLAAVSGNFITVGAYLSDRWGNPNGLVGTAVSFFAEGGSTQPITLADEFGIALADFTVGAGFPANGKLTIMAATQGEEAFVDTSGNGLYDVGEAFSEIGEPFLDKNENGVRDADELYIDVNGNGVYNGPNGLWDGPNCPALGCVKPATIWTSLTLTLSTDANCAAGISPGPTFPMITDGGSQPFTFTVQDLNGNSVLGGTTVTVTKTATEGTLSGTLSATISNSATGPATLNFVLSDSSPGNSSVSQAAACLAGTPVVAPATCPTPATVTVTVTPPASSGLTGCVSTSTGTID